MTQSSDMKKASKQSSLFESAGNDDILAALAFFFGFQKWEIEEQSRKKHVAEARQMIMYILREYGEMSFPAIGRLIGKRDHTTVIHGYNKTKKEVADHPEILKMLWGPIALAEALKQRRLQVKKELEEMNAKLYAEAKESIHVTRMQRKAPRIRTIPERDLRILEMYREGLTLQNISSVFSISRERIRQIVLATIQYLAINESLSKGIVMDVDVLMEEEAKKRRLAQEAKKPVKTPNVKERRWSTYYDTCRECDLTTYKHIRRGICERCLGSFRGEMREKIIAEHGGQCDKCHIPRAEAIRTYGRDLYIQKDMTVLCRKDFLKATAVKLGSYKYHEWSRFYPACKVCSTTVIPHAMRGLCQKCSDYLAPEERERIIGDHEEKCDTCGRSRQEQRERHKGDLVVTKSRRVLCRHCFQKQLRAMQSKQGQQ